MKTFALLFCLVFTTLIFAQQKTVFEIARTGTVEEMNTLFQQDPKVINSVDAMSFSPLILACYRGNSEVARFLMDNGADVNYLSDEGTALAAICINFNQDLLKLLLKHGADPNIADANGTTPLIWAVKRGNESLTKTLLQAKADKNHKDQLGMTAFEYAIQSQKENIINLFKIY
ncbi:ankyrin repeat domain-containing protein [Chryseobacterium sp. R2A-55]|uniref:ankyrin repeat domain-containing protein n=1 Tax=Chryseobacterium sp. R2A-55 TaxID=2744445 RepID=UPI001F1FF075|nr:ankyrin repeat domain-containing protein [Chryseobacterium sp. R2A-55]